MSNTTVETWTLDGVVLNKHAFNIETLDGSREGPPPVRGQNLLVPLRPGRIWAERFPDERVITLGMWVTGADPESGNPPTHGDPLRQFRANWQTLYETFYTPWRQGSLTKTWRDPATNTLKSATALVNYAGGLEDMTKDGPARGRFAVDLVMAEPYFYDDTEVEIEVASGSPVVYVNPGQDIHRKLTIDFEAITDVGPGNVSQPPEVAGRNYPWTLVNQTPEPDVYFTSIEGYTAGQQFRFDTLEFTARYLNPFPGATITRTGFVRNGGTRHWMLLLPGTNTLRLYVPSGQSATATIRFRPQYF